MSGAVLFKQRLLLHPLTPTLSRKRERECVADFLLPLAGEGGAKRRMRGQKKNMS
jgi:hypothetical protein